jgi:hypothetical protein
MRAMADDWQLLLDIFYKLGRPDHPLYRALAHADYPKEYRLLAFESALRSGEIPLCGCRVTAFGLANAERIETKIDADTAIDITLDEITLRNSFPDGREPIDIAVFKRVHADPASVERWLADEPRAASEEAQDHVEAECQLPERPCPTKRRRPQTESVQLALKELYPDDIFPDQAIVPNANLCQKVGDKIKEAGRTTVSDDTILRVARRRK